MDVPLQLHFHGLDPSDAITGYVHARAATLDAIFPHVVACRIAIESPGHRHQHGRHYRVRIDVTVPGHELVVSRDPVESDAHVDAYAAIDDAFDDMAAMLADQADRLQGAVKTHERVRRPGRVKKLFLEEGYGFLTTEEGDDVYFHQHSVRGGAFGRLKIGERVRFVEEAGDKGPQASVVLLGHA